MAYKARRGWSLGLAFFEARKGLDADTGSHQDSSLHASLAENFHFSGLSKDVKDGASYDRSLCNCLAMFFPPLFIPPVFPPVILGGIWSLLSVNRILSQVPVLTI